MAVLCSHCGRQYDITLFEFNNVVICDCGSVVSLEENVGHDPFLSSSLGGGNMVRGRESYPRSSEEKMDILKRAVDRVCCLILNSEYPRVDVEIERAKVRELCQRLFPDRLGLFDMIYGSRFDRLEEQFGEDT